MKSYLWVIMILVAGCGNDTHPIEKPVEPMPKYNEADAVAPYDFEKHQNLLNHSKLQYPDGETVIKAGEFAGYKSSFFYSDTNGSIYFCVDKPLSAKKTRSELRAMQEWSTAEATPHNWYANLKLFIPDDSVNSYTWMQIHGNNGTYNYPILRLLWVRDYNGQKDHLWAIIIINTPREPNANTRSADSNITNTYNWIDLGVRPSGFFNAEVDIRSNLMVISINGVVKVYTDVSYWSSVQNYFKGGVYINRHDDQGIATVVFKSLEM